MKLIACLAAGLAIAGDQFTGGAWLDGRLVTWGSRLQEWTPRPRPLGGPEFARSGCAFAGGAVLEEARRLVWRRAPRWQPELIDTDADMSDCVEADLLGHRGVLVLHRHAQLRLYERPASAHERWPYREIYSIYTASNQTGLALTDVDGDGRVDVFVGNYWARSPEEFDLPWRIFAINVLHDTADAASFRLVPFAGGLLAAQAQRTAPLRWFGRPPDVQEQWPVHEWIPAVRQGRGLALWRGDAYLAEDAGPGSRVWSVAPSGRARVIANTNGIHTLVATPRGLIGLGANGWRYLRR